MEKKNYKHGLILLYVPIYLLVFFLLEKRTSVSFHMMHSPVDDYIPFCEAFIIPYLLWFPYLLGGLALLFYLSGDARGKKEFMPIAWQIVAGLSFCLFIYFIWPNALNLRPAEYPRQNVLTDICALLQGFDTPTNVCPSIHVYSTLVMHRAFCHSSKLKKYSFIKPLSFIIAVLICLSTMFLKQHSFGDVVAAFVLFVVSNFIFRLKKEK